MTEESFKNLMETIVANHFPEESLIFEVEGDDIVSSIFKNEDVHHVAATSENLKAVDMSSATAIIGLIPVALTCYKVYLEIQKLLLDKKTVNEEEVKSSWLKKLKQHGIGDKKAALIVDEFAKEIVQFAK